MNILVIGSGGREHAICLAFSRSSRVAKVFCAPGNAGIAAVAECVDLRHDEVQRLADFAAERGVDITFVGGETSLALGIVDEFEARGLRIIGPRRAAAELEASKAFAKDFMARYGVPTAEYAVAGSPVEAIEILNSGKFGGENSPVVVKADGLAAGKGVVVAADRSEAIAAINEMAALVGSDAAERIVLEECLVGEEVSLLMFADGDDFALMPPVRDHKRIGEGDTGPNTGGMGTFTDAALLPGDEIEDIKESMIEPTLRGCVAEGMSFRGILFLGLMMTANGPKLLEYNVRFGDPETQAILVRLESDLVDICEAMLGGTLGGLDIKWKEGSSACVVLAAANYPSKPRTGDRIHGLGDAASFADVTIFHAGTAIANDEFGMQNDEDEQKDRRSFIPHHSSFITAGGRVLAVTATGATATEALTTAYQAVNHISFDGMQYRRDIGQ